MPPNAQAVIEATVIVGVFWRYCILFWKRKEMEEGLKMCEGLWAKVPINEQHHVTFYERKLRIFLKFMLVDIGVSLSIYVSIPYLRQRFTVESENRSLPFAFFEEVTASPQYEIIYAAQCILVIPATMTSTIIDFSVPSLIILNLCGYLRYLRNKISSLKTMMSNGLADDKFRKNLISCIKLHQQIVRLHQVIKMSMHNVLLVQVTSSVLILAVCVLILAGNDPEKNKYLPVMPYLGLQLFIYQWMSDILITESTNLVRAMDFAFLINDLPTKKLMIFCIMFSNRSLELTAGGFLPLSLVTFKNSVSKAYSIFAAFRRGAR